METETRSTPSHEVDSNVMESSSRVREKVDPAWEHFSLGVDEKGRNTFTCVYCRQTYKGGGINKMKKHLAGIKGDIGSCKKVSHDVRYQMLEYVKEFELKKKAKKQRQEEMFSVPSTNSDMQEDEDVQEVFSNGLPKKPILGKRNGTNPVDNYFAPRTTPGDQPGLKSVFQSKEKVRQADMAIARFLYDNCIPFNVVNSVYYQRMIDVVAAAGPSYKGPSYHTVQVPLLRDQKKEVQLLVKSRRRHWAEVGCTLMVDGWIDTRHKSLINFVVYCPRGMVFVKSVNASDIVKSTRNLFKLFDKVVTWVGPTNIVHMVTDNTSNYDMGDMPHVERLKKCASKVTIFIYNHVALIAWLRKGPGWTDIVRVGATRFTTTFLSFGSLHVHKHDLQALMTSKFFVDNRLISSPLICLLRIVDSDQRLAIGYVYEGMHRARLGIKKIFRMKKHLYKSYTSIIKNHWDKHLRKDLHAAGYWLNPAFQYGEENFCRKPTMNGGSCGVLMLQTCKNWQLESLAKLPPLLDENPYLSYEELENAIYEEGAYPTSAGPSSNIEESIDDSSEVEGIDLGTFGQPVGPPPGFPGNDDEHDNYHDIDDL
ncbi:uncharacterized protein LOC115955440 [Quercus lobata]|uniref:uncharacterized protein LOC115955440 n=1 Tax=Quercus lobata TaxID=97700 RepID=UPI001245A13C|nr:uncharacterized protein LOC115955440 [Quercus lobata]